MDLIQKYYMPWHFPLRKEFAGTLLFVSIFLLFPWLSRLADITSVPLDPGIFSAVFLAISTMMIFKTVTWWLLKTIWPVFADYSGNHFERDFRSLPSLHKVIIYLLFYVLILYGFILVLVAVV